MTQMSENGSVYNSYIDGFQYMSRTLMDYNIPYIVWIPIVILS